MDRSIKVFDIRTHKLLQHYGDAHGPSPIAGQHLEGTASSAGGTNSIAFGGINGEWLISTGMDGLVKVCCNSQDLGCSRGAPILHSPWP
jgi:centriolar protein POC1